MTALNHLNPVVLGSREEAEGCLRHYNKEGQAYNIVRKNIPRNSNKNSSIFIVSVRSSIIGHKAPQRSLVFVKMNLMPSLSFGGKLKKSRGCCQIHKTHRYVVGFIAFKCQEIYKLSFKSMSLSYSIQDL